MRQIEDLQESSAESPARAGAARREITTGKNFFTRPLAQGRRRSRVKFIAIGRENQPIAGVNLPGEH